jgi:hypothetical protein
MAAIVKALCGVEVPPLPPPPRALDDPATPGVLRERAMAAGISEPLAAGLSYFMTPEEIAQVCELVAKGCDPETASRIVR